MSRFGHSSPCFVFHWEHTGWVFFPSLSALVLCFHQACGLIFHWSGVLVFSCSVQHYLVGIFIECMFSCCLVFCEHAAHEGSYWLHILMSSCFVWTHNSSLLYLPRPLLCWTLMKMMSSNPEVFYFKSNNRNPRNHRGTISHNNSNATNTRPRSNQKPNFLGRDHGRVCCPNTHKCQSHYMDSVCTWVWGMRELQCRLRG